MTWIRVGSVLMAAGIVLGAFGAHGLNGVLTPEHMAAFKTAVLYQMVNALGLMLVGALDLQSPGRARLFPVGSLLTAGIVLFSGSLYLITVNGMTSLGLLTPVGGICLAAGWIFLIFSL